VDVDTAEVIHIDLGVAFDSGKLLKTPEIVPFRLTRDMIDGMGVDGVEGIFRRCCEQALRLMKSNSQQILTVLEVLIHDPLYRWSLSPNKIAKLRPDSEQPQPSPPVTSSNRMHASNRGYSVAAAADTQVTNNTANAIAAAQKADENARAEFAQHHGANAGAHRAIFAVRMKLFGGANSDSSSSSGSSVAYNSNSNDTNTEGQVQQLISDARSDENLSKMYYGWNAYL
jgi:ataxia telangiectasia mutated family protein